MTDIVERLRKVAPNPLAYDEREAFMLNERDRHDAADEIERLRAKLAEYESAPVRLRHIMATGKMPPDDMK